jgi:hypothetical protein
MRKIQQFNNTGKNAKAWLIILLLMAYDYVCVRVELYYHYIIILCYIMIIFA